MDEFPNFPIVGFADLVTPILMSGDF